jgi:hypothetical protein
VAGIGAGSAVLALWLGILPAWLLVLMPLAVRVIPIEDMKVTGDYATMFELAARRRHSRVPARARMLRAAPARLPAVLSGLRGFAAAQIKVAVTRRLRLAFLLAAALLFVAFAVAMAERGDGMGVALSLAGLAVLSAEVLGVPELLLDKRVALCGRPFSRSLSLALAPHGRVLVILALAAGLFADLPAEALLVWLAAALLIVPRFLMKLAWYGRSAAAARDGFVLAAGSAGAYALAGPMALLLLPALPAWFYAAAKNRVERA